MKKLARGLCVLVCLFLPLAGGTAPLAGDAGPAFRTYQKARAVLKKSIGAHGGEAAIRALDNVWMDYAGQRTMINQSRRADGPWDKEPASGRIVVDRKNNRMFAENYTSYPGIGRFGGAWAINGTEGFHWEPDKNHHGAQVMAKLSGADTDGPWSFVPRWMPPYLLLAALENGTNLRWVETFARRGQTFHAISFTQRDRSNLVAVIDAKTHLLEGFETIRDDGVFGDATEFVRFDTYRTIAGVKFPTRRIDHFNGAVARELALTVRVNVPLDDSLFALPPGYPLAEPAPDSPRIRKIADGVYLDQEMGGVMVVEFQDFLLILECPGNYWMSQSTIDAVTTAIPGKPIRYVVPSHTHGDHGGGARAYFHLGATLITTPGHVAFFTKLARIKQTIRPDPLSQNPKAPIIETFKGQRVITDGKQTVVLQDAGPNAHAEELTFAYLPAQKLLWQADLVFNPMTGKDLNRALPVTVEFARKLRALGLTDIQLLVEAHHSRLISGEDFRASLRMAGYEGF